MAQEEIIFKLGVDTGDSVNKVSDVEEQFDILKKTISDTEREVDDLTKQFGKNSQEVENARKKLGNLNASFNELKQASINVNSTFAQVYDDLQPLTTRLGEAEDRLYELSLAGKQNTKEYKELLETVGRYKQTQIETDRIVDQAAMTMTQKLGAAIQGAANGFMVVQGASALFGDESKELEKALLKVQAAMALAQGIEGVRQAIPLFKGFASTVKDNVVGAFTSLTTAQMANAAETGTLTLLQKGYALAVGTSTGVMKAFRIALASTGIGLLVVALGYLVEKMMSYMSSTDDATRAQDRFTASVKRYNDEQTRQNKKLNDSIQYQLDYAKAVGASEEKQYQITKEGIAKREKLRQKELKDNEWQINYLRWAKQQAINDDNADLAKSMSDEITALKTKNNDLIDLKYQLQREEKLLVTQHNTDLKKEQSDANKEALAKQKEASQKAKQQREQDLEDIRQNKIKQQEIENQRIATQETLENEYYDSFKTQQQLEEQAVRDKYFNIIETTKDNETLKLAQQKELDAIAKKYKDAADKEENDRQNNLADKYEEYYNEYYDATTAAYQKEQDAVNAKYFYLIEKAKEYGLSTVELEKKRVEELDKIQTPQKQALQDFKNLYGELSTAIQTSTEIDLNNLKTKHSGELELLKDNYGEKQNYAELEYGLKMRQYNEEKAIIDRQRAFAEFQKKLAIVQTTIDTAKSLSSTIAGATQAAAAGGPAAPFLLASYIATGIATVTTAYAKVKTLLNAPMPSIAAPKMPREMKDGNSATGGGTEQTIKAQSTYKVVVVDSDITKMQDKTKKVNAISTI